MVSRIEYRLASIAYLIFMGKLECVKNTHLKFWKNPRIEVLVLFFIKIIKNDQFWLLFKLTGTLLDVYSILCRVLCGVV